LPPFDCNWAFFLDFDGTLIDIAATPESVDASPAEIALLAELRRATKGALALISGRSIARMDKLFAPLVLPAAGQHGAERRDAQGRRHRYPFPAQALRPVAGGIRSFAAGIEPVFRRQGASVALHYRLAPELAGAAYDAVRGPQPLGDAVSAGRQDGGRAPAPPAATKGRRSRPSCREAPFAGRTVFSATTTDNSAFRRPAASAATR
jgi:trehalose 6-phosphate phosphatase